MKIIYTVKSREKKYKYLQLYEIVTDKEKKLFAAHLQTAGARKTIERTIHDFYTKKVNRKNADLRRDCIRLFGSENNSDYHKISNGLSDLYKLLRQFLVLREANQDSEIKDLLYSRLLDKRGAENLRLQHDKAVRKKLTDTERADIWTPYHLTRYLHDIYFRNGLKDGSEKHLIEEGLTTLQDFYDGLLLKYTVEAINIERVTGQRIKQSDLSEITKIVERTNVTRPLANRFYVLIYRLLTHGDPTQVAELQSFVTEYKDVLRPEERLTAVLHISNFLVIRVKRGVPGAMNAMLQNYKFALSENLLTLGGVLDKTTYENIINVACSSSEFVWAEKFATQYRDYLQPTLREDTYRFAQAVITYEKGDAAGVILLLDKYEPADFFQGFRFRALRLFASALADEDFDCETECDNFRRYVQRKNLSEEHKTAMLNFVTLFRERYRFDVNLEDWRKKTEHTKPLYFRSKLLKI